MSKLQRAEKVGRRFENPVPTAVGGFALAFKLLPQFLMNRAERAPQQALGPFRTDAAVYATAPESGLRVTWMGHSSMLVEIDGVRVLVDPVWDQRASPYQWMGPKRFFAAPLRLEDLPRLDAVLVSHDHYDHLGEGTVRMLAKLQPDTRWVTSLGVGAILERFGVRAERITELDWTEAVQVAGQAGAACQITSLPARHFSGRSAFNRFETLWASFVLRGASAEAGRRQSDRPGHAIYYGADSGWWQGFTEIGAKHGPFDLAMLEIGAYNQLWQAIHMGPDGAARAFQDMGSAGLLMPIHWGLFDLALHPWRWPMERLLELAQADGLKLWAPEPGVPTELVRGQELRSDWWR
ncbi:MAG: MBL fold metallo-hydrolase [Acidobacteriaceae bacterium]|jgi:L-ascorbate metabolism protein UlaG (beta-lactamase superfamily)